jgi:primosomal protein N' (replication factor Y)
VYAHVALPIPVRRTFAYALAEELADDCRPGSLVQVPFGSRSKRGIVVELNLKSDLDPARLKPVTSLVSGEPVISSHGLELARWMADYYLCPIGEALAAQLPGGLAGVGKKRRRSAEDDQREAPAPTKLPRRFSLTAPQARAVAKVTDCIRESRFEVFLLHGITGSGKTQVYLEAALVARRLGGQALFLVPEVALSHGLVKEVRRLFGSRVGLLHSYLTDKERHQTWERTRRGAFDVVVGARSAVFAPLPALRLIVVDEEHEPAYKQSEQLRYHGRDVAVMRARMLGVPCMLGSATPSLESFTNAQRGKFELLSLPERIDNRPLPTVEIVDQNRSEEDSPALKKSKRTTPALLTPRLGELVGSARARGEQVLLFLNRRGHSRIVECEACGYSASCPHCDLTLTFHSASGRFLCHYCEYSEPALQACPQCANPLFRYRGSGTQRVERELIKVFPDTRIDRLDSDSARRRGVTQDILESFGSGEGEILVGTQLVAKGHDFAGVTLVGVLNSDTALHIPDFRASERTFQLLTQVAGRAGRGNRPGHVVLQTHHPDHPALVAATGHDYAGFAESELAARRSANYPPWSHLISFLVSGPREDRVVDGAERIGDWARGESEQERAGKAVEVLGPAPQTLSRLRGRYRWHVTLRSAKRQPLHQVATRLLSRTESEKLPAGVKVIVDVDPVELI